ncbi:MAG: hypothetical protein C0501_17530 [Isosphaera sp.]|nr:hypothetical protein [Isosphaera sp.]
MKRRHIEEQYAARREGAEAYRDQEMARLFDRCTRKQEGGSDRWTQDRIAERMGRRQSWVSKRLVFGRFLAFIPTGISAEGLTERRFREHWKQTKKAGGEDARFRAVLDRLQNGIPTGEAALHDKHGIPHGYEWPREVHRFNGSRSDLDSSSK